MTNRGRLVLAAACLLSGTVAAQPSAEDARAAADREAQRYTTCWMRAQLDCVEELTHRELLEEAGLYSEEIRQLRSSVLALDRVPPTLSFHVKEVAEPWPPFSVGGRMFVLVPYLEYIASSAYSSIVETNGRLERMAFLIGASEDDGESWRFIAVRSNSALTPDQIDRVIPGYGGGPLPPVMTVEIRETPFERTRWLETTERQFVLAGDAFVYSLTVGIREEIEGPIDLVVRYDDPADRDRPLEYRELLPSGQRELKWQSQPMAGFEMGLIYDVVIEGSDPDTGNRLFEHRQEFLYHPTPELWAAVMSKQPPVDPPSWAEGCIVSTDASLQAASEKNARLVGQRHGPDSAGAPFLGVIVCGGDLPLGR